MNREEAGWIALNMYFHERSAKQEANRLREIGKPALAEALEAEAEVFDSIAEEEVEEAINQLVERKRAK